MLLRMLLALFASGVTIVILPQQLILLVPQILSLTISFQRYMDFLLSQFLFKCLVNIWKCTFLIIISKEDARARRITI